MNDSIDAKKTAMLFYDMQNAYCQMGEGATRENMALLVKNAAHLARAGREMGMPIIFARGDNRPDGATQASPLTDTDMRLRPWAAERPTGRKPVVVTGDWSAEIIPELDPRPEDYYIPKHRWSAFYQTYLDLALRSLGVNTLIISGNSTDIGVAATVYSGRDRDYHLIVVCDACATPHDQRAHDALMTVIFPRMCRIRTTDEILAMMQASTTSR